MRGSTRQAQGKSPNSTREPHVSTLNSHPAWAAAECASSSPRSCWAPRRSSERAAKCLLSRSASATRSCFRSSASERWAAWLTVHWESHTLETCAVVWEAEEAPGEEDHYSLKSEPHQERSAKSLRPGCLRYAAWKLHYRRRCSG